MFKSIFKMFGAEPTVATVETVDERLVAFESGKKWPLEMPPIRGDGYLCRIEAMDGNLFFFVFAPMITKADTKLFVGHVECFTFSTAEGMPAGALGMGFMPKGAKGITKYIVAPILGDPGKLPLLPDNFLCLTLILVDQADGLVKLVHKFKMPVDLYSFLRQQPEALVENVDKIRDAFDALDLGENQKIQADCVWKWHPGEHHWLPVTQAAMDIFLASPMVRMNNREGTHTIADAKYVEIMEADGLAFRPDLGKIYSEWQLDN